MPPKWKTISRLTTTRRAVCGISTKPPAAAATHVRIQNSVAAEESHFNCSETIVASRATPAALNRIFQEPGRIATAAAAPARPTSNRTSQTAVHAGTKAAPAAARAAAPSPTHIGGQALVKGPRSSLPVEGVSVFIAGTPAEKPSRLDGWVKAGKPP